MSEDGEPSTVEIDSALAGRLDRGFGPRMGSERTQTALSNTVNVWKDEDKKLKNAVCMTDRGQVAGDLQEPRQMLLRLFDRHPEVVRGLLHEPEGFVPLLKGFLSGKCARPEDTQQWRVLVFWYEVLWEYLHTDGSKARSHRHLIPLAARNRFLILSEPFRHPEHAFWDQDHRTEDRGTALGHDTWAELLRRAQESRGIWKSHLSRYQSFSLFDRCPPSSVEEELRTLAFRDATFSNSPLVLADPDRLHGEKTFVPRSLDLTVMEESVEQHLLPRFAICSVWAAVVGRFPWRLLSLFSFIAVSWVTTLALVVVSLARGGDKVLFDVALGTAGLTYLLIGWGTVRHGRFWTMPFMLRLPAAAAAGLIVLVAMHPDWWKGIALNLQFVLLLLLLVGVSFGYLLIETRNHNSGQLEDDEKKRRRDSRKLFARAGAITVTGLVHSFLVALLGMAIIAPAFSEDGKILAAVWQGSKSSAEATTSNDTAASGPDAQADTSDEDQPPPSPTAILLAATAWCLAAGVFSQILWDDQPITAPLSHRRWRNKS